ncbi:MAG: hypothetical protein ACOCM4_08405 [Acetivibrio ethanolgignens]
MKEGYQVKTYCFRLYCQDKEYLQMTKTVYNLVVNFYYDILSKESELESLNRQQKMRQLELMTVGGKEGGNIKYYFPFGKVPLYFRRAAINDAIRLWKSYVSGNEKDERRKPAGNILAYPVFYKGMYKNFTETGICLKLWNGEQWKWIECGLDTSNREFFDPAKALSPMLKLENGRCMLHIPVKETVGDARTIQERFLDKDVKRICAVAFPANDYLAVLAVMDIEGSYEDSLFIRGGSQMMHEKKKILNRIRRNQASMGIYGELARDEDIVAVQEKDNKALREKISRISEHYAHRVSRQIVNFCKERKITVLVVPNYYKQNLNLNTRGYLKASSYDWIGRRIIQYLRYKAFGEGIMVASVGTRGIASKCYLCGGEIRRFNGNKAPGTNYYGGKNFLCPNGHKGNAYFNTAMNIGRNFLKSQAEMLK